MFSRTQPFSRWCWARRCQSRPISYQHRTQPIHLRRLQMLSNWQLNSNNTLNSSTKFCSRLRKGLTRVIYSQVCTFVPISLLICCHYGIWVSSIAFYRYQRCRRLWELLSIRYLLICSKTMWWPPKLVRFWGGGETTSSSRAIKLLNIYQLKRIIMFGLAVCKSVLTFFWVIRKNYCCWAY